MPAAEVVAGAEAAAVALDDDDRHVRVALGHPQGVEELAAQRVAQGVHLLRTVQGDPGQRPVDLVEDVLVVERLPVVRVVGRHRGCLTRGAIRAIDLDVFRLEMAERRWSRRRVLNP